MKLIQLFKKYFIPHEGNEHKPHLLRPKAAALIACLILFVETIFLLQAFVIIPTTRFLGALISSAMIDETNSNRVADDLSVLQTNPVLALAAQDKANDMASKGYFAHTSPAGITPWYWFKLVGYNFAYAGENLAVNFSDSKDVVQAWMNSPDHRANILNDNFTEIGIATAEGTFENHPAVFVVQLFGTPLATYLPSVNGFVPAAAKNTVAVSQAPVVIAEASTTKAAQENLFVAVKSAEIAGQTASTTHPVAPQTEVAPLPQSNFLQSLIASPRFTVNYFLYFLGLLITVALVLNVFVKIRIQHKPLIVNGLVLLLLVTTVIFLNQHLFLVHLEII